MIWGRNAVANTVPAAIDFPAVQVFGSTFPAYKGLMMAISVTMFAFLYVALKKTRIGLVIQAALTHPQMVSALGHDVPGVFVLVFADRQRARRPRRRDRRLHAAHRSRRWRTRSARSCSSSSSSGGLGSLPGALDRVDDDRHPADVRGRGRLFAARPAARARRRGLARLRRSTRCSRSSSRQPRRSFPTCCSC